MQNKAYKYAFNVDIATWICLYSAMPVKGDNGFFLCVTETTRAYITGILLEVYSMFRNSAGIHKSFHNGSTVYCSATFPTFKRARLGRKKKKKGNGGILFLFLILRPSQVSQCLFYTYCTYFRRKLLLLSRPPETAEKSSNEISGQCALTSVAVPIRNWAWLVRRFVKNESSNKQTKIRKKKKRTFSWMPGETFLDADIAFRSTLDAFGREYHIVKAPVLATHARDSNHVCLRTRVCIPKARSTAQTARRRCRRQRAREPRRRDRSSGVRRRSRARTDV